jgi:hypothetical protein
MEGVCKKEIDVRNRPNGRYTTTDWKNLRSKYKKIWFEANKNKNIIGEKVG